MSWVIDTDGDPMVVLPASLLVELIAGNDGVCADCSQEIARVAERLIRPFPWREAVRARISSDFDQEPEGSEFG